MEEEGKGLGEYLDIFIRRRYFIVITTLLLSAAAVVIVKLMPATYKSEGLILIEAQEIPSDLVKSTVTSYADQRIQIIKQRIMTTANVMEIVKKFNLYEAFRKKATPSQIVGRFKENMLVNMVEANVTDPRSGRQKRASIAFTVSFLDPSPNIAQIVASELVTKFLTENVRTRTEKAAETELFLKEEAAKFQKKIQVLEKEIADFKNEYSDSLPELLEYNLSTVERLENELVANRNQIMALKDQVAAYTLERSAIQRYLSGSNNGVSPYSTSSQPVNPLEQQLIEAQAQYNELLTRYSGSHPDVIRLKKQVESLKAQMTGEYDSEDSLANQIQAAETELNGLKQRYSDTHPDVKAALKRLDKLKQQHDSTSPTQKALKSGEQINPLYLQLDSKIKLTEREIQRLVNRQAEVNSRLANFEQRVVQTHQVKRAYDDLIRDHANHLAKYQELKAKQLEAELAQNLETENKGESFSLIEPPQVPTEAEKPNRPKLMAMGVIASAGAGFGLALFIELLFGGVRGYREITKITGQAPLIVVPLIYTNADIKKQRIKRYRYLFYFLVIGVASVVAFHFFVMNLEILWFKVLRKISLL